MIDINVIEKDSNNNQDTIYAEIHVDTSGEEVQMNEKWHDILEELANSEKRIVFRVENIDPNGFVVVVLNVWLKEFSKKIYIKTSQFAIREILSAIGGEEVVFVNRD